MKDKLFKIRKNEVWGFTVFYKPVSPMDEGLIFFDDAKTLGDHLRFHKDHELQFVGEVVWTNEELAEIGCYKCRRKVEVLETGFCEDCQEEMELEEELAQRMGWDDDQ